MKQAIIAVSFGTSYPETRRKTIEAVEKRIAAAYPTYNVVRAFTSNKVIKKIREQEGLQVNTLAQALAELLKEGCQTVIIQPLHIINGNEYTKIIHQAAAYQTRFQQLKIGKPLLTSFADFQAVADWLTKLTDRQDNEAVVVMGHGSQHTAFTAYACLDHMVMNQPVFVCAVESYPGLATIIPRLKDQGIQRIRLFPLMLVAGDHATNDMASDDKDSWKTQLEQNGFQVQAVLKGMGEYLEIQQLFIDHLAQAMEVKE